MIRIILNYIIPLLLPILIYFFWILVVKKRFKSSNHSKSKITSKGLFSALVSGLAFMLISIIIMAFLGGSPPGEGKYESPKLDNGKIVPPKME